VKLRLKVRKAGWWGYREEAKVGQAAGEGGEVKVNSVRLRSGLGFGDTKV